MALTDNDRVLKGNEADLLWRDREAVDGRAGLNLDGHFTGWFGYTSDLDGSVAIAHVRG